MSILIYSSLFATTMLFLTSHPVTMVILIITQTLLICLMMWNLMATSWFAFILFLIFVGGLMVLFIYTTSLAANEKFEPRMKKLIYAKPTLFIMVILTSITSLPYSMFSMTTNSSLNQINMMFTSQTILMTLLIMTYLLVTLIVVVKISDKMEGPIRNVIKKL